MKRATIVFSLLFLISCQVKTIPLKGSYTTEPFIVTSPSNFETVWSKIIDYFATNGVGIKLIDKSSGLIIAQNTAAAVTHEDAKGNLVNKSAWIVAPRIYDPGSRLYFDPSEASVEWNIRIKPDEKSGTKININLITVSYIFTNEKAYIYKERALSTRVFENKIADEIR